MRCGLLLVLAGSVVSAGAADQAPPRSSPRSPIRHLLEHLPAALDGGSRQLVEELLVFEAPLRVKDVRNAEVVHAALGGRATPMDEGCASERPPLGVLFADYTIGEDGQPIPGSTGWSPAERQRFTAFLCRMLPVVQERYGPPFRRWRVTLVKDLQYSSSWVFIPSLLEIHSDGAWNPRLLTHEFIHAFRGRRTLTNDSGWHYSPRLSGFEEGFAEGVAYLAMNDYVARFCDGGDCSAVDVPSGTVWHSYLESVYDFSNDASLTSEDFWSDAGGTLKYYERYLMAAAAIMRLEQSIPGFSRRFNQEYYARIRNDPAFRPTRDAVVATVESLSPAIDGMPAGRWLGRQRVFDARTLTGKRSWLVNYTPYQLLGRERMNALYFLETFPSGSEWAQYIADCPVMVPGDLPYLFYRQHGTAGRVALRARDGSATTPHRVVMQNTGTDYRVSGCNDVIGEIALAEVHRVHGTRNCEPWIVADPTCIRQPAQFGLYELATRWRNPQYRLPSSPPTYAMPYDASQETVTSTHFMLAGDMPADFDPYRHRVTGAIRGARDGQLTISHSARPGMVTVPVRRGAFYAEVPICVPDDGSCWVRPLAAWTFELGTVPGTLTFDFIADDGRRLTEQRTIVFGNGGRHEFLLGQPEIRPAAPAIQ